MPKKKKSKRSSGGGSNSNRSSRIRSIDSNRPIAYAKSSSGSVSEAAKMMRVLRYGETVEDSQLLSLLTEDFDREKFEKFHLICIPHEPGTFPSWTLNEERVQKIDTSFRIVDEELNSDEDANSGGEFNIEIGFVHDEVCRMLKENVAAVITVRALSNDLALDSSGKQLTYPSGYPVHQRLVRSWVIEDQGFLSGLSEAELFDAYHTDFETGDPIPGEVGEDYAGSRDIIIKNL